MPTIGNAQRAKFRYLSIVGIAAAATLTATCPPRGEAQSKRPKIYVLKDGAFQPQQPEPDNTQSAAFEAPPRKPAPPNGSASKENPAKFRRMTKLAAEIERLSGQAFHRALMDLDDYSAQLNVALQLRLAAADFGRNPQALRRAAFQNRAEALQAASVRTEQLQQPGAAGWASETAYSKLLASTSAADWAKSRGEHLQQQTWVQQSRKFAKQLLSFRGWDHQFGLTGDRQLNQAKAQVVRTDANAAGKKANAAKLARLKETLNSHVARMQTGQTHGLRPVGKGNTRPDQLHAAKFQLLRTTGQMELAAGRKQNARDAFLAADRQAVSEFRQLLKFHRTGTSGLADLTRNWRERKDVHQQLRDAGYEIPIAHWRDRQRDLRKLGKIAAQTLDRRGRAAADVAVVQGLMQLEKVRPFIRRRPQGKDAAGSAASQPVQPKIIDVRKELDRHRLRNNANVVKSARRNDRTVSRQTPRRRTPPPRPARNEP